MRHITNCLFLGLGLLLSSFQTNLNTKLYPKIEGYFNTLDLSSKREGNAEVLRSLKGNIELSEIDEKHTYLLRSENSDAVAFAQIILHSWLKEKKFRKVDLLSCSPVQTISDAGLQTLKEIGYYVRYENGTYTVLFSEGQKPLKLTLHSCTDKKLERSKVMNIVLLPQGEKSQGADTPLYYSQTEPKEMFRSLAVDLFSIIKELKK